MASEAVKAARINRKAQQEKMLYDALMLVPEFIIQALQTDGLNLLASWVLVEYLQNSRAPWADPDRPSTDPSTHYIGAIAAGALQTALTAGFTLNGFAQAGGTIGKIFK